MRNTHFFLAGLACLHSLFFSLFWLTNRPYHRDVNGFLANLLGKPLEYVSILLVFSVFILLSSLAYALLASRNLATGPVTKAMAGSFAGLALLYVVFFYGSYVMLFREDPVQLARLAQLWRYFRLLPDAALLLALVWGMGRWLNPALAGMLGQTAAKAICFGVLVLGWAVPLWVPPGNVYRADLPPKPLLIAHRGAAWLSPENTRSAMLRAAELGVFGLESDVHLSRDGVLFLLHDANLKRTTNVEQVFPGRAGEHASLFSWEELSHLNSGAWFTLEDPFRAIASGKTAPELVNRYAEETIPRLQDMLEIVSQNGTVVLFDLYDPPEGHPYHGQALNYSLEALHAARLGGRAWVLASVEEIAQVRDELPDATLVTGIDSAHPPSPDSLLERGYQVVNSEYSLPDRMIRLYRQAGLWVNLYTVDEPWQISRLWLLGTDSITSNNVHSLGDLERPVFGLAFPLYLATWTFLGLAAASLLWLNGLR